ncbi:MAG: His-Xaa-Ser system radical SAM maturase HxsC [Nostoc sp. DedQUE04]|uniref:His-Xaa-Ser system radical SAM maturase HxsC n=1 Tax=Nostoc sp. DedQUE04 TaxID=3075390 RepID=UPI002AD34EEB|nr:His-Xaa-Ser system radical SAM maturase HxsC [Nostoc sp. DedQUE04]MDZ8135776.1 His-Xaa-Ser system radical SAM maturase HxsC [Nostoc sp. DedQUE04]
MLKLYSRKIEHLSRWTSEIVIGRLTDNINLPFPLRSEAILLVKQPLCDGLPTGFRAYLLLDNTEYDTSQINNCFRLNEELHYLNAEDVVRFDPKQPALSVIYRRHSNSNSLLVTERCNNYCLMCSQPPKDIDDGYLVKDLLTAIPLISRETKEMGITGGEPTLLGEDLLTLIRTLKNYLPETSVHILSNGRKFASEQLACQVAQIKHSDLMIGIPLYSDISNIHDYVVQADGAFDETIRGILNLKRYKQKVEIRVVIHKQTYSRLPELARFIARNLLFVDHVAFMGLEMMGFTRYNIDDLWIDPTEYQPELVEAVEVLAHNKMVISVYNHQLCLLDPRLYPYNRKSISDWKNEYMPECKGCLEEDHCGGFFSSAIFKYSDNITPFLIKQ